MTLAAKINESKVAEVPTDVPGTVPNAVCSGPETELSIPCVLAADQKCSAAARHF